MKAIISKKENNTPKRTKNSKFKKIMASVSFALCGSFIFAGCAGNTSSVSQDSNYNSEKQVVTIGYLPITHSLAVLKEKELLEENNFDIQIKLQRFSSWTDLMDALNAGKIDGASVLIELAMNAKANGIDLKAVALGHRDGNVVVASNDIESVDALKGKTIAIPSVQSSQNILLNELLERNGMSKNDVNIIQMSPTEMPFSLASGAINGYCVAEPYGAVSISKNFGKVFATSDELWNNSLCCALVLNGNIRSDEKVTNELIEKYYRAAEQLESEGSEETAGKFLGQETSVIEESGKWINFKNLTVSKEEYDDLCNKLKKYGINENPPSYEDFIYNP